MRIRSRRGRISSLTIMGTCQSMAKNEVMPPPRVLTSSGIIEGLRHVNVDGKENHVFLGVPYAQPPVGDLRFRKPVPMEKWEGIRKCRKFGDRSVQTDFIWDKVTVPVPQSEDCLHLNIYAPRIQPGKKYPVMFYIHGGGFVMDSTVRYTTKNVCRLLVSRGIIVVTIQYRLGYLGWFCTGDAAAKGNFGLWDQLEALKWTKANIAHFGGDPEQLTVAGQSAGAVSTDLLSMSPLSRDLFCKKIVMGASSFCSWAVTDTDDITKYCRKKAEKLGWKPRKHGYDTKLEESEDMMEFMRKVPAQKLGTHMIGVRTVFDECRLPLAPVIDGEILPLKVSELRKSAPDMPSVCGVGENESLLFLAIDAMRCTGKAVDKVLQGIAKRNGVALREVEEGAKKIYGDSPMVRNNRKALQKLFVDMTSDIVSNYACWRYMQHSQTLKSPTFSYSFDYMSRNMWGWLACVVPFVGGTHTSDIIYLFDCNYFSSPFPMSEKDQTVSRNTANAIAEFVKTGNPNANGSSFDWKPVSKDGPIQILSFKEQPEMKPEPFENRMAKLDDLLLANEILASRFEKKLG